MAANSGWDNRRWKTWIISWLQIKAGSHPFSPEFATSTYHFLVWLMAEQLIRVGERLANYSRCQVQSKCHFVTDNIVKLTVTGVRNKEGTENIPILKSQDNVSKTSTIYLHLISFLGIVILLSWALTCWHANVWCVFSLCFAGCTEPKVKDKCLVHWGKGLLPSVHAALDLLKHITTLRNGLYLCVYSSLDLQQT